MRWIKYLKNYGFTFVVGCIDFQLAVQGLIVRLYASYVMNSILIGQFITCRNDKLAIRDSFFIVNSHLAPFHFIRCNKKTLNLDPQIIKFRNSLHPTIKTTSEKEFNVQEHKKWMNYMITYDDQTKEIILLTL